MLINYISDTTIMNYINEVGRFKLPNNIDTPNMHITYYYGAKINEILFKKTSKFIKKNYKNSTVICLQDKGHCEDALIHPQKKIKELDKILIK